MGMPCFSPLAGIKFVERGLRYLTLADSWFSFSPLAGIKFVES